VLYKALQQHHHIEPEMIPPLTLSSGDKIPGIGFGTFGSDHITTQEVANAVDYAIRVGYRHFDCASVYGNEFMNRCIDRLKHGKGEHIVITQKVYDRLYKLCKPRGRKLFSV
jgi:alcohol dehydrogenase (NADP+)